MINLLIVDDSALMRKLLVKIFAGEPDFAITQARNGAEALAAIAAGRPDVVTLDIHMPDMDGLACLDRIMVEQPCPVVMFSSLTAPDAEATFEALRRGAVDVIAKPAGPISLEIEQLRARLVATVRAAASARLSPSLRLKDRVRHRFGAEPGAPQPAPPRPALPAGSGIGLVLVGSSTGGPPALEALLGGLPAAFPWPIVVAQHMPAGFTASLARRLDGLTALQVCEVADRAALRPGGVYIARGDADILIAPGPEGLSALSVAADRAYPWHPSADRLVRSAMAALPAARLAGVLMTGMGHDGAAAMAELHAAGGRTIAEAESTAIVWGMPGELVRAKGAEFVLPLPAIAARLRLLVPANAA